MEDIRNYILSVICAAIICSVIHSLTGSKSAQSAIIRLLTGIFMSITLISPIINIKLSDYTDYIAEFRADADDAIAYGQNSALVQRNAIIKSQTEAYILDKAALLDAALDVEVTLNQDDPPIPCGVKITGAISPYSKVKLSQYIANDLGIAKEDQVWER